MPRKKTIRVKKSRRAKAHARVIKVSKKQTGKTKSIKADKKRKAMKPGKRISKTGNIYYERRRNRSDKGKYI